MSLWGATVITNLMSAIPWIGQDIVEFLWGGFSVNNATLNRFFALHFLLPFVITALAITHLVVLHDVAGSSNPIGVSGNSDKLPFSPYFIFKDLITFFLFILCLSIFVFFMPNILGDSENYVVANPMQTPPAIVPEWYLLPFYAVLRSIPNKLLGVIFMFSAILILLIIPYSDIGRTRGIQFRPLSKILFFLFVANFLLLMKLGAKHVENPYIEFGQICTSFYFMYFGFVGLISLIENNSIELLQLSSTSGKQQSTENIAGKFSVTGYRLFIFLKKKYFVFCTIEGILRIIYLVTTGLTIRSSVYACKNTLYDIIFIIVNSLFLKFFFPVIVKYIKKKNFFSLFQSKEQPILINYSKWKNHNSKNTVGFKVVSGKIIIDNSKNIRFSDDFDFNDETIVFADNLIKALYYYVNIMNECVLQLPDMDTNTSHWIRKFIENLYPNLDTNNVIFIPELTNSIQMYTRLTGNIFKKRAHFKKT